MTDDFHFYLLRRADDYVTAIRPTADIDRFGFPAWHGWAISKAWRDGYAAAINEGGQAPCESTDGCTRAQVTWEQAISHAGTDHAMAAQPVPPSPDEQSVDGILARLYGHPDGTVINSARRINDAIAALRAERDALQADAERYRWLRQRFFGVDFCFFDDGRGALNFVWPARTVVGGNLDAAIDAARKEQQ